jgi:Family of unknown function (DUF6603)
VAGQDGTLEAVGRALARLLQPLGDRLAAGELRLLFAELGLQFPASIEAHAGLMSNARAAGTQIQQLPGLLEELADAIDADDVPRIVSAGLKLTNAIRVGVVGFESVGSALKAAGAGGAIPQAELNQFGDQLPTKLLDYLAVRRLEAIPGLAQALDFVGGIERTTVPGTDAAHPPFVRRALHIDELTAFVENPAARLQARYGWGDGAFDGSALLTEVYALLRDAGLPAVLDTSGAAPVLDVVFLDVSRDTTVNPPGLRLALANKFVIDPAPFQQDDWEVRVVGQANLDVGAAVIVQPNDAITIVPPGGGGTVSGDVQAEFTAGTPGGTPYTMLGAPGGSRLEARQLIARAGVGLAWNAGSGQATGDARVGGEVKNGKLVISLSGADGFIGKVLGGFGLESDFSFGFGYSTKDGIYFVGSSSLEIQIPLHVELGPVELRALTAVIGIGASEIPLGLGVDIKAALGPLQAVVEQIGANAKLKFPPDHGGNAGPVDFQLAFRPPKGVGLSLDTGVVKGGGYLFIDTEKGEYAGALELTFSGIISLKAIGLITTRMPDGSSGFSLLIIITAEFGTGIQLGFGFTLLAVGGLIGLNRAMRLQPLAESMRTGAIESVMFPHDVVANAPKIISDLRTFFPPEEGKTLIGPMAKLGWGTPTLVSLSIGVIIEIPGNIAIVGILKIALPTEDAALIVIQVNFIGAIEFDKQRFWFFASMYESRVIFLTIEGEMGVLAAFGDDANFVLSVGGFHPQFNPPPLPFPSPRRISINILNQPLSRIRVEGYFAVTTNTAQFGARAELFFGFSACSIEGHLGFDALFQFSPFRFIIEISFSVSLKVFGMGLFGIHVQFTLEGPSAWRASGTGSISFFFFDIDVDFDITWGEGRDTSLPPIEVMPVLEAEVRREDNWRAALPAGTNLLVSLRQLDPEEAGTVLHPVGTLKVSQRAVPLDVAIAKVGNRKPSDAKRFSLTVVTGGLSKILDVDESFAPAQFDELGDGEKLSRPAYEPRHGGIELSVAGNQLASGAMLKRVVRYDLITIDTLYRRFQRRFFIFSAALFAHFLNGASVTLSVLSQANQKKLKPFEETVMVGPETFAVAFVDTNSSAAADSTGFTSVAMAQAYAAQAIADDPSLEGSLHVIPQFEVAA